MSIWTELLGARIDVIRGRHDTRIVQLGEGPGLLLLHGQGGSLENFRRNIRAYAAHFHVAAIDLQWHGCSGSPPVTPELLPEFLDQVDEVVSVLGWRSYAVEGQSLGGWVAALHTLAHPDEIAALVLTTPMGLDPSGRGLPPEVKRRTLDAQLAALRDVTVDGVRQRLAMLFADATAVDDEIVELRYAFYRDPTVNAALQAVATAYLGGDVTDRFLLGGAELARLAVPSLVYWGSGNIGGDPAGRLLAAAIPGAEYHCADTGHWAQYERAEEHNRVVLDFLLRNPAFR